MSKIGNYEIHEDEFLGKGSFSVVYKGKYVGPDNEHVKYGQPVAIKIVKTDKITPKSMKVIEEEIEIMNLIKKNPHPNIVECYDVTKINSNIYIFMEYCDSGDLRGILRKPIREKFVQFYFSQLVNGLKYLDQKNIIHRDIKPRNLLLTKNRRVLKIADFGFAKKAERNSLYDTICGSPMYMAPEILDEDTEKYDDKIDLWSIGMILYEMLYGVHPYHGCKSMTELRQKNKSNYIIKIPYTDSDGEIKNEISSECLSLLRVLLEKDSSKRITWSEFFCHPWLNIYQYIIPKTNKRNEEYEEQICAVSLGSLINRNNEVLNEKLENLKEIDIIDNYYSRYNFESAIASVSSNEIDSEETYENNLNESNMNNNDMNDMDDMDDMDDMGDNDPCIFEMEVEDVKIKTVIDKECVFDDISGDSHHYHIVDSNTS